MPKLSLPTCWKMVRLGEVITFTKKPRGLRYSEYNEIPFVPMELIPIAKLFSEAFIFKTNDELSSGTYFEPGDILLPKITPSFENGKQCIIKELPTPFGIATTEVIPIREVEGVSDRLYLFYYLLLPEVRASLAGKMQGTTGRQRLNIEALVNLETPLPPLPEQRAITHILQTIQEAKFTRQREIALERERKAALMDFFFSHGTKEEPRKQTEISEIPESWEVVRLGDIADITYGVQAAVAHLLDESIGLPILTNINITLDGTFDLSTLRYYELPKDKKDKLILKKGDLLFNWRSGSQHHVGKTVLFDLDGEYTFSSFILRFRFAEKINNVFAFHYFHYLREKGFFALKRSQSSVNSVFNASKSAEIPVVIPSVEEQSGISGVLQACDAKITALEQESARLDELFHAMLDELMTGQRSAVPLIDTEMDV